MSIAYCIGKQKVGVTNGRCYKPLSYKRTLFYKRIFPYRSDLYAHALNNPSLQYFHKPLPSNKCLSWNFQVIQFWGPSSLSIVHLSSMIHTWHFLWSRDSHRSWLVQSIVQCLILYTRLDRSILLRALLIISLLQAAQLRRVLGP